MKKSLLVVFSVLVAGAMLFAACASPEPEKVVETVIVTEKETVIETVEVEKEVEVVTTVEVEVEKEAPEPEYSLDDLGIEALDDTTVQFTLEHKAGFFPAIAGMWVANPMPEWNIDEWGVKWTEAGLINTNGPYVLDSWIHGGELDLVKNPLWPEADDVQIERVEGEMIVEASTAFALYENGELDSVGVPLPEMDRVKADPVLSEELINAPYPCTYYYGFTTTKPPFDDVRVRTAFAQSIDRQSLIDNVTKGGQTPATSFAPPGIFGAPEPGKVGLAYDPETAMASLQAYLDEEGMTIDDFNALGVTLMHNTSEGHATIAAAIQQMWADNLGVEVRVENQEWKVYLTTIKNTTPLEEMPHIWRLGWCADYPDENNWIHEVFNSEAGANRVRHDNADFDALTEAAAVAEDPAEREALYEEAEKMFAEEMVAYAPIYHYTTVNVTKPWLTRNFPPLGANDFYNWVLGEGRTTLNWNWGTEPPTLDPSLATDTTSVDVVGNTFVGLTKFDPVTGAVSPYLATSWEAGEDADGNQTWTFYLRDDIPWVHYNPTTGETTQVVDADGNPRFVNAHDVVYGVKRTIDPATASDYAYVLYIIKNAAPINAGE